MDKISLSKKITAYAHGKYPLWVNGADLERLAMNEGFKASNAGRRCRELENLGILERRMNGKSVEYRYNPKYEQAEPIYRPEYQQEKRRELTKLFT